MKSNPGLENNIISDFDCVDIYLKQGEYYISNGGPARVSTILGSCVTVTMYCPILNIGGITHSLLPFPLSGIRNPDEMKGRYVNLIVRHVFNRMTALGAKKKKIEVKIFGGGQMFLPSLDKPIKTPLNIGRRNVETALKTIQELGLNITATDVGGLHGRKLVFFPHRGDVWIKKINRTVCQKENGHD